MGEDANQADPIGSRRAAAATHSGRVGQRRGRPVNPKGRPNRAKNIVLRIVRLAAAMYVVVNRGSRPGTANDFTSPRAMDMDSLSCGVS
jgi:hypothetical protein